VPYRTLDGEEISYGKIAFGVIATVVAVVMVIGCLVAVVGLRQQRVNEAEIGVYYTDGPFEGQHFDRILEPGDSAWIYNDHVYKMPARQITWITGPGEDADAPALTFTAQGGEQMVMTLTTRFELNTTLDHGEGPFKDFFTGICQSFDCWEGSINNNPGNDEGWNRMLNMIVGNPQIAAAKNLGLAYEAESLRYSTETREEFASAFADEFERLMSGEAGVSNIFCGPGYKRGEAECPPISVRVTDVQFADPTREAIREQEQLAQRQVALAEQQRQAAAAQQTVNAATATPEYVARLQAEAMRDCAQRDGCSLSIVITDGSTQTAVPVG